MVSNTGVDEFTAALASSRLLAIVRGSDSGACVRSAVALIEEGFDFLEVSLNTAKAIEVIAAVVAEAPVGVHVGAGTVMSADDVTRVRDAGATFIVTPAVSAAVTESVRLAVPVLAGALTPTEAMAGLSLGAAAIKLFPASFGGPGYLRALRDPFPELPVVPVGGIGIENVRAYLSAGALAVGVGSPLLGDATTGGSLGELRLRARGFIDAARSWRAE